MLQLPSRAPPSAPRRRTTSCAPLCTRPQRAAAARRSRRSKAPRGKAQPGHAAEDVGEAEAAGAPSGKGLGTAGFGKLGGRGGYKGALQGTMGCSMPARRRSRGALQGTMGCSILVNAMRTPRGSLGWRLRPSQSSIASPLLCVCPAHDALKGAVPSLLVDSNKKVPSPPCLYGRSPTALSVCSATVRCGKSARAPWTSRCITAPNNYHWF
jgi:hypothetical protein